MMVPDGFCGFEPLVDLLGVTFGGGTSSSSFNQSSSSLLELAAPGITMVAPQLGHATRWPPT
jgi:hypothetical protein